MTRVIDPDRGYERAIAAAVGVQAGRCPRCGLCRGALCRQGWPGGRGLAADRADWGVTAEQLELVSTDPQVMHGQAVLTGTRAPVSVILDCLAAGMTVEEIIVEIRWSPRRVCGQPSPTGRRWRGAALGQSPLLVAGGRTSNPTAPRCRSAAAPTGSARTTGAVKNAGESLRWRT